MKKNSLVRIVAVMVAAMLLCLAACGSKNEADTFNVGALKGPSSLGLLQLMGEGVTADGADVALTVAGAPDEMTAGLLSGSLDAACVPINLAPVLYNKTEGGVQIAAVASYGMLYIVGGADEQLTDISELKGQTIYGSGQGSTPEYVLNYILEAAGLTVGEDVEVVWMSEHSEVATKLLSDGGYGLLPEPFVTTVTAKDASLGVVFDMNELWNEATGTKLMMTAFVVRSEYAEANKGILKDFLKQYEESAAYTNENVSEAAALAEQYEIIASAAIAEAAIPRCSITYLSAADAKDALTKLYEVFYEANPSSVGGAMPGEDFWYAG